MSPRPGLIAIDLDGTLLGADGVLTDRSVAAVRAAAAAGWYVVLAALLILSMVFAFRWLKAWRRDTYRRQAVRELAAIRAQGRTAARQLPLLMKRTALAAWPRQRVAVLSGAQWHAFLDSTAGTDRFGREAGALRDRVA